MKRISAFLLGNLCALQVFAYDFQSNGLCYNVTSNKSPYTVEVTFLSEFGNYPDLEKVSIPSTVSNGGNDYAVTAIGKNAFMYCEKISSVTIPSSVKNIGVRAFYCCRGLKKIVIPNSVTEIGNSAFNSCVDMTSVTIGSSVETIGDYSFAYCNGLENIEIPNSVKIIGTEAFNSCVELKKLKIGNSAREIGEGAFSNCKSVSSVLLGESVENIGSKAFAKCESLTEMVIPNSTKTIGSNAFDGCTVMKTLVIGNSVKEIGATFFANCPNLKKVTIGTSVKKIESGAFDSKSKVYIVSNNQFGVYEPLYFADGCVSYILNDKSTYLTVEQVDDTVTVLELPASLTIGGKMLPVTQITASAFADCKEMKSVQIPESVEFIDEMAFALCSNLDSIAVVDNNKTFLSIDGVLFEFGAVSSTVVSCFPPAKAGSFKVMDDVKAIGGSAFMNCAKLAAIEIPNNVDSIAENAFSGCESITQLSYNTAAVGSQFRGKKNLVSVIIGKSVSNVQNGAFDGCNGLTSVTILSDADVSKSGLYLTNNNIKYGVLTKDRVKVAQSSYSGNVVIPATITAGNTFTVESVADNAFKGCAKLTSVVLPSTVNSIGTSAFDGDAALTTISIPDEIKIIGEKAFDGCKKLNYNKYDSAMYLGNTTNPYVVLVYVVSKDKTDKCEINSQTRLIYNGAFADCKKLTSVTIPDGVARIDDSAFSGCGELASVSMTNSVVEIGNSVFSGCAKLATIAISDSLVTIGNEVFNDCKALKYNKYEGALYLGNTDNQYVVLVAAESKDKLEKCTISEKTRVIYNDAFKGCTKLTGIAVPNTVVMVGTSAFDGCKVMTKVTLSNSITKIASNTFNGCAKLSSIEIPATVTAIESSAFSGTALSAITIPTSVKVVDGAAFKSCSVLSKLAVNMNDTTCYNVTLLSDNPLWGGSRITMFELSDGAAKISFEAFNKKDKEKGNGKFIGWSDGDTVNIKRDTILLGDLNLTALFEQDFTGIEDEIASNLKIYSYGNTIVVENADTEIRVYDAMGRLVSVCDNILLDGRNELQINAKGVYIVRVGDFAQKCIIW